MTLKILVNNEKELSGYVRDLYFVIYKDSLENRMNPTSEIALVEAAAELATLTALLKEAGEALEENDDILRGLANNHHFQMVGAGNKHHSENFSECQASTCKAALKQIRRAAEIRKKIQEVLP